MKIDKTVMFEQAKAGGTPAQNFKEAEPPKAAAPRIRIEGLGFTYPGSGARPATNVLDGVTLSVREGEFVCLIGPSGCGKSSLITLVAGYAEQTTGTLLIDNKKIDGPGPERVMVFQSPSLFPWYTVRENIAFGMKLAANRARFAEPAHPARRT